MKLILFLLILSVVAAFSGCGKGCGCSAYYKASKDGSEIEIQFRVVTTETVGGHTDCGFKHVPTRVTKATLRGAPMREIEKKPNEFWYAAPADFDPKVDEVIIEVGGVEYVSWVDKVNRSDDSTSFELHSQSIF